MWRRYFLCVGHFFLCVKTICPVKSGQCIENCIATCINYCDSAYYNTFTWFDLMISDIWWKLYRALTTPEQKFLQLYFAFINSSVSKWWNKNKNLTYFLVSVIEMVKCLIKIVFDARLFRKSGKFHCDKIIPIVYI